MQNGTVSEEIQGLLETGLDSSEIIERGYRPGTVYKVQRRYRKRLAHQEIRAQEPSPPDEEPRETDGTLAGRAQPHAEADMLATVTLAITRADQLAEEVQVLTARLIALEQENGELIEAYRDETESLEAQLSAVERLAAERGEAVTRLHQELAETSRAASLHNDRGDRFWRANQALEECYAATLQQRDIALKGLASLAPLQVWDGHPCSICNKPMSGSVTRELAATLMKNLAHARCVATPRSGPHGLARLAGFGALAYGLSRLR